VRRVTEWARAIGYTSVNYDLIYGLPLQTADSIAKTITEVIALRPDRIAFYSYAHVPWTSKGQRLFDENDLLPPNQKLQLYHTGRELFLANGYNDIGMDHFSLPNDDLYLASVQGRLHRNFMGYTTQNTGIMLGLGVSSISCTGNSFAQNAKTIHDYYAHLKNNELPVEKGYFLTDEDIRFGKNILDLSCRGITTILPTDYETVTTYCHPELNRLQADGLVLVSGHTIEITPLGRNFIRNVCAALDLYLQKNKPTTEKRVFSSAV
jgi:oxygen-independent coproporphyrinogen-3 oxidase